jgi:N utilization substance protein A
VRELRNENIDVLLYSSNPSLLISRALQPAHISSIEIDEDSKEARAYLSPDQVSLAIGKGGFNIKLASMLTNYNIDVFREEVGEEIDDIYLDQFNDEIDQWVLDAFKRIGCETARDVLAIPRDELVKNDVLDLDEETIDHVISVLNAEFEN